MSVIETVTTRRVALVLTGAALLVLAALWWPLVGVATAGLVLSRVRAWPAVIGLVLLVIGGTQALTGTNVTDAVAAALVAAGAALVSALVLGAHRARPRLHTLADLRRLLLGAGAGAAAAGLLTAATARRGPGPTIEAGLEALAAYGSSLVLVLPVALLLSDDSPFERRSSSSVLQGLAVAGTLGSFAAVHAKGQDLPLAFVPFLFLVVSAQVLPARLVAFEVLGSGLLLAALTSWGGGPFLVPELSTGVVTFVVQVNLVVIMLVGLPLALAVEQRRTALAEAEQARGSLEIAVERLEALDRVKSEFLLTMSHELRTPLTSIIGFTDLLSRRALGEVNDGQAELLSRIDRGARRLTGLVENVLAASQVESADTKRLSEPVRLSTVLDLALEEVEHLLWDRDLDLNTSEIDERVEVDGDLDGLRRAVVNLLSNAVNFTPDGGRIDVSVTGAPNALAVVTVSDTGVGIGPRDLPHVRERFYRGDTATEVGVPGSGLGLSVVEVVVKEHRGRLSISSTPGHGTSVELHLPQSRRARAQASTSSAPMRASNTSVSKGLIT